MNLRHQSQCGAGSQVSDESFERVARHRHHGEYCHPDDGQDERDGHRCCRRWLRSVGVAETLRGPAEPANQPRAAVVDDGDVVRVHADDTHGSAVTATERTAEPTAIATAEGRAEAGVEATQPAAEVRPAVIGQAHAEPTPRTARAGTEPGTARWSRGGERA